MSNHKSQSILVGKILFCSMACAKEYRCAKDRVRHLKPGEFSTEEYGALCPVCEEPYEEF